jgi:hypothetical protein
MQFVAILHEEPGDGFALPFQCISGSGIVPRDAEKIEIAAVVGLADRR